MKDKTKHKIVDYIIVFIGLALIIELTNSKRYLYFIGMLGFVIGYYFTIFLNKIKRKKSQKKGK